MPKVKMSYIQEKKDLILDAAFKVAMSKSVHEVSMRDIILETGLSQGGIYRYFSNIDEIYISLINRNSNFNNINQEIEKTLNSDLLPEKIIYELFLIWKKLVLDNLVNVGKIYYELCTVYISDKERLNYFIDKCEISKQEAYFQKTSIGYIAEKVQEGYFKPNLPFEDIIKFLATSFDGIIRNLILSKHYDMGNNFDLLKDLDSKKLIDTLYMAFISLLNGESI